MILQLHKLYHKELCKRVLSDQHHLFHDCIIAGTDGNAPSYAAKRVVFFVYMNDSMIKYDGSSTSFSLINAPDTEDFIRYIFIFKL